MWVKWRRCSRVLLLSGMPFCTAVAEPLTVSTQQLFFSVGAVTAIQTTAAACFEDHAELLAMRESVDRLITAEGNPQVAALEQLFVERNGVDALHTVRDFGAVLGLRTVMERRDRHEFTREHCETWLRMLLQDGLPEDIVHPRQEMNAVPAQPASDE